MIETFTSPNELNYPQHEQQNAKDVEALDSVFYESIKSQLDMIKKDPSEDSVAKILAYSKSKII